MTSIKKRSPWASIWSVWGDQRLYQIATRLFWVLVPAAFHTFAIQSSRDGSDVTKFKAVLVRNVCINVGAQNRILAYWRAHQVLKRSGDACGEPQIMPNRPYGRSGEQIRYGPFLENRLTLSNLVRSLPGHHERKWGRLCTVYGFKNG